MGYKIKLELFEGPLDLLLYLIKKDHLNIYDIPVAEVTEQYLKYLEVMKFLDLNVAGEFLVMAATLMQIKSKMLLPAEESPEVQEEEDPRDELVKQLLEYEKFKEIAEELRQRETNQRDIIKRPKLQQAIGIPEEGPVYFEASIFDLISAFSSALADIPKEVFYEVIKDEFTVEEKIHSLLHLLLVESSVRINELFGKAKHKIEIIVTFLAILELIKLKEAVIFQKELFGEIEIARNKNNIIPNAGRDQTESEEAKEE
jgi:segregation and condensation protein A